MFCGDEKAAVFRGFKGCLREVTGMAFLELTLQQGNFSSGNAYGELPISLWNGLSKLESVLERCSVRFKINKFLTGQIRSLEFACVAATSAVLHKYGRTDTAREWFVAEPLSARLALAIHPAAGS